MVGPHTHTMTDEQRSFFLQDEPNFPNSERVRLF